METERVSFSDGFSMLMVQGDVDLYSAVPLYKEITELLGGAGLIIDFSEVEYLDSSGVGVVIKTLQAGRERNIPIRFAGIHGSPRRVLSMSNVLTLIKETDEVPVRMGLL